MHGKKFPTSLGEQLRDFCYIDDVVEGMVRAAVTPQATGQVINIASGEKRSIRSVIEKVVELAQGGEPDFGKYPYRNGENMELYADDQLAKDVLGWRATTSLDEGLKETISWYRDIGE